MVNAATSGYDWSRFAGSREGLKWARRDLPNLDRVIARVPQKRVAVQAGGNLGVYPKRIAEAFEVCYTFEPSPELFPLLCQNAPESNIVRFQAALGYDRDFVGTVRERRNGHGIPHEGITHINGAGPIPTMRVDDLHLPQCDLIQLDVEGWEQYALLGAVATITRCRPVLCVEFNANARYVGVDPDDLRTWILSRGYIAVDRLQSDEVFLPC